MRLTNCGNLPCWFKPWGQVLRVAGFLSVWTLLVGGCANVRITDPARTATEQFLLSQAGVKAVELLSFEALHGRSAFLDVAHFAPMEKEFVLGEFRAKLLKSGVRVSAKREDAEIILEVRSAGVGIDRYESLFGIPSIAAPSGTASAAQAVTLITPEIAITKKIRQIGFASVAYVAYWAESGDVVASSGPVIGKTYREDWWLLGFGPRTIGSIPPVDHKSD